MQPALTPSHWSARGTAVALAILVAAAAPAAAQDSLVSDTSASVAPEPARTPLPRNVAGWVAVSPRVPMKSPGGVVHGSLIALGASVSWTLQQGPFTSLRYRVDVMPVMLFSEVAVRRTLSCSPDCVFPPADRDQVYAAGVVPLALELGTPAEWRAGVVVTGSGGMVVSRHPIPYPTTSSFNFLAAAGVSAHLRLTGRVALTGGVQRAHLSNGKMKPDNPGMDYTTWQVGVRY